MSAALSAGDIRRIARLAHLDLSDDEVALYATQLSSILAYAKEVQAIETTGVEPTAHVTGGELRLRQDEPQPSLERDTWIDQAPDADTRSGLVKVPKVL